MKLRYVIFSLAFLLVSGKCFCSDSSLNLSISSSDAHVGQDRDDVVSIDDGDLPDLIDEGFLCFEEENSSHGSNTSRGGGRNGGKVFGANPDLPQELALPDSCICCINHPFLQYHFPKGKTAPLFLLHRAFRI